jgi:hypothetical protein
MDRSIVNIYEYKFVLFAFLKNYWSFYNAARCGDFYQRYPPTSI